jgi:hypothetical protein
LSPRSDIAAAFAIHASVKSFHDSQVDFNAREVFQNPDVIYQDDPSLLSGLAASGAEPLPDVDDNDDDDEITAIVEEAEHRMPQPVQIGDIRYPDCE